MKRAIAIFCCLCCASATNAQTRIGLDPTFGDRGVVITNIQNALSFGHAVAIQSDQKIVATGQSTKGVTTVRYNTNGTLDNTFGNGGLCFSESALISYISDPDVSRIALQLDGKIIISGYINNKDYFLQRIKSNGVLDSAFGVNGTVIVFGDKIYSAENNGLLVQPDGKILLGGNNGDSVFLARLNANGTLDNTFGTGGITKTFRTFVHVYAMDIMADGKIVVAGESYNYNYGNSLMAARYLPDGRLDSAFGDRGFAFPNPFPGALTYLKDMHLQADGKMVLGGTAGGAYLFRLGTDGSLDSTFGTNGLFSIEEGDMEKFLFLPDGRIVGTGRDLQRFDFFTLRVKANGVSLDSTFGRNGTIKDDMQGWDSDWPHGIALQQDGRIVVCGHSGVPNGTFSNHSQDFTLARYLPDAPLAVADAPLPNSNNIALYPNPAAGTATLRSMGAAQISGADIIACRRAGTAAAYAKPCGVYAANYRRPAARRLFYKMPLCRWQPAPRAAPLPIGSSLTSLFFPHSFPKQI